MCAGSPAPIRAVARTSAARTFSTLLITRSWDATACRHPASRAPARAWTLGSPAGALVEELAAEPPVEELVEELAAELRVEELAAEPREEELAAVEERAAEPRVEER